MERLQRMVAEAKAAFDEAMPPRPGKGDASAFQARSGVAVFLGISIHEPELGVLGPSLRIPTQAKNPRTCNGLAP